MSSGDASPTPGSPVVDMIEVRVATRVGCSMARAWAIMPPIEAPTTWADSTPRCFSSPAASAAMSEMKYGTFDVSPPNTSITVAPTSRPGVSIQVDPPTSRLSNRTTWKPRATSRAQNPSSHMTRWAPRPMISSRVGFDGSPKVS